MNVVLVSIGNFQEYILTNIKQLVRLQHQNIYVITNRNFFDSFAEYSDKIHKCRRSLMDPFGWQPR